MRFRYSRFIRTARARAFLKTLRLGFPGPEEAAFRRYFDEQGLQLRAMVTWVVFGVTALLLIHEVLQEEPFVPRAAGLASTMPVTLSFALAHARKRFRRWSVWLFTGLVTLVLAIVLAVQLGRAHAGGDFIVMMLPVALLLLLTIVNIRFALAVPLVLTGLFCVLGAQSLIFTVDHLQLTEMLAAVGVVVGALINTWEKERNARREWRRQSSLDEIAHSDVVTGLYNRRYFDRQFRQLLRLALRSGDTVTLMLLDLDNFKAYNDSHGHAAGDELLSSVGQTLGLAMRRSQDFAARLGGDELAVVWYDAGDANTRMCESLRKEIAQACAELHKGSDTPVTASAGCVELSGMSGMSGRHDIDALATDLVNRADQNLYRAKHNGRDHLVVTTRQPATG